MTTRKRLIEELKSTSEPVAKVERSFVFGAGRHPERPMAAAATYRSPTPVTRVPFTTRIRADMAQALKRASLERQLEGVAPFMLQEILESVLEPWLRDNGYLS